MQSRVAVGGLSPRTVANYTADLGHFITHLGPDTVVDDIDAAAVDQALSRYARGADARYSDPSRKLGPGRSPSTQARFKQSINRFFQHAEQHAWVQVSPMPWVTLDPRHRGGLRTARTALTLQQAAALLEHGAGPTNSGHGPPGRPHERNHHRDRYILAALAVLGPRISELCAADDDDFTTDDGEMWRIVGKGGRVRTVPLSPWLSSLKRDYLDVRPKPVPGLSAAARSSGAKAAFRTGHGARMAPRDVQRLLGRASHRVLLAAPTKAREVTPHALRHTAATLMLSSGWDVKVVAQMLGHASIATTGIYLDELPGELAAAVADHPLNQAATDDRP